MIRFNCLRCDKVVPAPEDHAGRTILCPHCGYLLRVPLSRLPRYWIFKYNPDKFGFELLQHFKNWRKSTLDWRVPQSFKRIKAGDIVFLWRAGVERRIAGRGFVGRGIVGAMRVTSPKAERHPDCDEVSDYTNPDSLWALYIRDWEWRVDGVLIDKIGRKLDIREWPQSASRFTAQTVYSVSNEDGETIAKLAGFDPTVAEGERKEIGSIDLPKGNSNGHGKIVFYSDATVSCADEAMRKSSTFNAVERRFWDYTRGFRVIDDPAQLPEVVKIICRSECVTVDLDRSGKNRSILLAAERPAFLIDPSLLVDRPLRSALAEKELLMCRAESMEPFAKRLLQQARRKDEKSKYDLMEQTGRSWQDVHQLEMRVLSQLGLDPLLVLPAKEYRPIPPYIGPFGATFIADLAKEICGEAHIPECVPEEEVDYGGAKWPIP